MPLLPLALNPLVASVMTGRVSDDDLLLSYSACDLFVLPKHLYRPRPFVVNVGVVFFVAVPEELLAGCVYVVGV